MRGPKTPYVFFPFILVGLILLSVGGYLARTNYQITQVEKPIIGKLLYYTSKTNYSSDGHSTTMYAPVFEFYDNDTKITKADSTYSTSRSYSPGDKVEIFYSKKKDKILVNTFWGKYFWGILLSFMGVIFAGIGSFFR